VSRLSAEEILLRRLEELKAEKEELEDGLASIGALTESDVQPVSAAEFLAEPGDFDWTVGGLLAEGSVAMMVADPKVGKTTLLVQLALSLGVGREWLGYHIPRPVRVLYVLAEGSRHAFRSRFRTTCASMGINPNEEDWFIQPAAQTEFNLRSRAVDQLFRASHAKVIVLDTLGYFHGGDENDSREWKDRVMAPLRKYVTELGCSFILVHHNRKASQMDHKRTDRARGSSAMLGDVDHWLCLEKVPLSDEEKERTDAEKAVLDLRRELFVEANKYGREGYSERLVFLKDQGIFRMEEN
jgi:RecA-family ATPase